MIFKPVHIARVQTLATGDIRLTIDILGGDANDIAAAFNMQQAESLMLISTPENIIESMQTVTERIGQ